MLGSCEQPSASSPKSVLSSILLATALQKAIADTATMDNIPIPTITGSSSRITVDTIFFLKHRQTRL
jgi:hypothetical protein